MKALGLLCALAALAACSEGGAPGKSKTGTAGAATGWVLEPGTYEYARPDGAAGLLVLAGNGTYSDVISGGDLETGAWRTERRASCLVAEGLAKRCYTFTVPDAQGRFSGKAADGSTMTARKLE